MTREQVWDIIGDIDDRFIAEAAQYDGRQSCAMNCRLTKTM